MAKETIVLEAKLDTTQAQQSVGSFRSQLKAATADLVLMSEKFGLSSTEAQNAAKKVAGLKDAIGDAKALADTFNPDKKFVALGGALQGVTAGFSAYSGAMGLLGSESKEVEKLLLKVQSAMALQQGISGIAGAVDSFKLLGNVIVEKVVTAFSTMKGAIIATGIGALAVGVGLLIANFDKLKETLGFATKAQQAYTDTLEDYQAGAKSAIEKTNQVRTAFDNAKAGVISKDEALKTYNNTLGYTFGKAKSLEEAEDIYNKKAGVYIQIMGLKAQANALFAKSADEAAKGIVAANQDNLSWLDKTKAVLKAHFIGAGTAATDLIDAQREGTKEVQADAKKISEDLYQAGLELGTQAEQLAKDNAIKLTAVETTKHETTKKAAVDNWLELISIQVAGQLKSIQSQDEAEQIAFENQQAFSEQKRQDLIDDHQKLLQTKAELAELALLNDPDSIDNKIAKINADLELELFALAEGDLRRQILEKEHSDAILDIKKSNADAEKKIEDEKIRQGEENLRKGAALLDNLSDLVGKHTVAGKALAISSTIIQTYQGATAALTSFSTVPIVGTALGFVAAAAVVASGLKSIQKIASVKVAGKGGGGGAPSMPALPTAPLIPTAQTTQLNQQSINAVGNAASRAYVLESDVSGNQERITRLNRAARIN